MPADYSAEASAIGSAGGLVGLNASFTQAKSAGSVKSYVDDNAFLTIGRTDAGSRSWIGGATVVTATHNTRQHADSSNVTIGLVAAGAAKATASSDTETRAYLGDSVTLNGSRLLVKASGTDENDAATTAGSGGVIAGGAAVPEDRQRQHVDGRHREAGRERRRHGQPLGPRGRRVHGRGEPPDGRRHGGHIGDRGSPGGGRRRNGEPRHFDGGSNGRCGRRDHRQEGSTFPPRTPSTSTTRLPARRAGSSSAAGSTASRPSIRSPTSSSAPTRVSRRWEASPTITSSD